MPLQFLNPYVLSLLLATTVAQANYPAKDVKRYIEGCTGGYGSEIEAICKCIIRKAQEENISYERFQQLNRELDRTGQVPAQLRKIINACQEDSNS